MSPHSRQAMPPPSRKSIQSHNQLVTPQRKQHDTEPSSDFTTSSSKKRRRNKRKSHGRGSVTSSTGTSITRTTSNTSTAIQDYDPTAHKEESTTRSTLVPPPSSIEEHEIYAKEPEHFGTYDISDDETYEEQPDLTRKADTPPATFSTNVFGDETSTSGDDDHANDLNAEVHGNQIAEQEEAGLDQSDADVPPSPLMDPAQDEIEDKSDTKHDRDDQGEVLAEPKRGALKRKREPPQQPRSSKKRARSNFSPSPEVSIEATQTTEPAPVPPTPVRARSRNATTAERVRTEDSAKAKSSSSLPIRPEVVVDVSKRSVAAVSGSTSRSRSADMANGIEKTPVPGSSRLTVPRKKTKLSTYTSAKGKDKAEDDVEYSSPPKQNKRRKAVPEASNERGDESDGLATTVARRTLQPPEDSSESFEDKDHEDSAESSPRSKSKQKRNAYSLMRSASKEQGKRRAKVTSGTNRSEAYTGGETGKFTDNERQVLYAWRDRFCEDHSITRSKFNDIMTQTARRKKTDLWPYTQIVSRNEFMAEYYDQLPDRNRRSMNRFREREFQNVTDTKWSVEDDRELSRLVEELGPRWVEIAQEMERTQDSVYQRWRNKVQFANKVKEGEWILSETQQLQDAVAQYLDENQEGSKSDDPKISWSAIATRIGGARTAQQCSNKWRNLTMHREDGKYIQTPLSDRIASHGAETRTPSKMQQRLIGEPSTVKSQPKKRGTFKSAERIVDSDDNQQDSAPEHDDESDESQQSDVDEVEKDDQNAPDNGVEIEESSGAKDASANSQTQSPTVTGSQHQQPSLSDRSTKVVGISSPVPASHDNTSPPRKSNLFVAETPFQGMSMTQLHQGTQANTTAKRTIKRKEMGSVIDESTSQHRMPSPDLPLRQRPISSPLQMLGEDEGAYPDSGSSDEEDNEPSIHTALPGHSTALDGEAETESTSESSSGSGETDIEFEGDTSSESEESSEEEGEEEKKEQRRKGFLSSLSMPSWPWSSQRNGMLSQGSGKREGLDEDGEAQ